MVGAEARPGLRGAAHAVVQDDEGAEREEIAEEDQVVGELVDARERERVPGEARDEGQRPRERLDALVAGTQGGEAARGRFG